MRQIPIFLFLFIATSVAYAQSGITTQRSQELIDKAREMRQRIETRRKQVAPVEEKKENPPKSEAAEGKAFIKVIQVTGARVIAESAIRGVTSAYENKELTLADMQTVADKITDLYRQAGYVTSTAVLPPQKIKDGILAINVVEGKTGDVEVRNNLFFSRKLILKQVKLKKGEAFNINELRAYLVRVNEHPDISVKSVLAPGKEPGTSDVVLDVKDSLPLHAEFVYDDYGSRSLRKNRYSTLLTDNNLTGQGDILTLQYQISDAEDYRLLSGRYLLPINDRVKLGFFAARSRLALGREFREVMARGKSDTYSIYTVIDLINKDQLTVAANLGFDYKNSINMQMTDVESKDMLRVPRLGLDIDASDDLWGGGRTIISPEIDLGVPGIMGGMKAKDPIASRAGSGGKYVKETLNAYRLQNLPWNINLLWKNSAQASPDILTASEQFQLGGISNMRGYPSAYKVGDQGLTTTFEFTFPLYGLDPNIKVPFCSDSLAKALKLALFYDWGYATLHHPQSGEHKQNTLADYGVGTRFDLSTGLSLSMDVAWPVVQVEGEDHSPITWFRASQKF